MSCYVDIFFLPQLNFSSFDYSTGTYSKIITEIRKNIEIWSS